MKYRYRASNHTGGSERGEIDADSPRAARQLLRERHLTVYRLTPVRAEGKAWLLRHRTGIKGADLVLFTRQFATLVGASLTIEEALLALARQSEKLAARQLLTRVRERILEGQSLSMALGEEPGTFNPLYRALIAAGEASGQLASVLIRLADHLEQQEQVKGKVLQALLYPLVLTVVAVGVIAILLTTVVPQVMEQFIHLNQLLPLSTRILLALSDIVLLVGPWLVVALLCAGGVLNGLLRRAAFRRRWDGGWLRLPLIGNVARELNISRFARTLSILTGSAVPVLEAMTMAVSVCSNDYIRAAMRVAQQQVKEGIAFSTALNDTGLLSPMMRHMIASGERSGELDNMLERAATLQEQTFQRQIALAVGIFTPLLVMMMAGVVFFIVLAIMQPILQLNSLI